MDEYGIDTFGKLNAENYDAEHDPGTTEESVDFLAGLIRAQTLDIKHILELAIGTGRIALPLAGTLANIGARIHGIDASAEMLAQLNLKSGERITAEIANMADFELTQRFEFAYLVFNTLFNLPSQAEQVSCFQATADHLAPGGSFLVEAVVPELEILRQGQSLKTNHVSFSDLHIDAATHDAASQVIQRQRVRLSNSGVDLKPFVYRYVWPSEMDLMARLAGLKLEQRWGDWHGGEFNNESNMHISLYRKESSNS